MRDARERDPQIYFTHIARVDGGIASIWQGDAAYDDLDTEKPGPRNRLLMLDTGWRLETGCRADGVGRPVFDRPSSVPGFRGTCRERRWLVSPTPSRRRFLDSPDLRWACRLVVLVTAIALLRGRVRWRR